jgi:uncharacterized protein YndB with AHSA1/START domain
MVRSAVVVAIDRPIEQVFAFVANAETASQWREEIVDVRRTTTAGPIGVGTTYQALHTHLGERAASTLEIIEYEPNRKVSFEGLTGPDRFRDSYAFQSVGASTRITFGFDLATQGHGTRSVSNRQAADLSKLKLLLEAQGSAARPAPGAAEVQSPRAGARSVEGGGPTSR